MNTARMMSENMTLGKLLESELTISGNMDVPLTGIELDSRRIDPGDLFIACKGDNHDGRDFISEVIDKGAAAVLVEAGELWSEITMEKGVPIIPVENLACRLNVIAARFFHNPADSLWLIGITGTNGKTSCCQFIAQAMTALGHCCGVSGTLGYGVYGKDSLAQMSENSPGTTPDPIMVQRIFSEVLLAKADTMAMEVSSHGLKQGRVNVNEFDAALFTNLSRDHLDFHGSMRAYGEAKLKLFNGARLGYAIVNIDDLFSSSILNSLSRQVKSYTFSMKNSQADIYPETLEFRRNGFSMSVSTPWGNAHLESKLLGSFNVENLLAVIATVLASESRRRNFDFPSTMRTFEAIVPVRGRMEVIGDFPLSVVVDYAHSPDALENALNALHEHYQGNIWCVFGCGGERDKGKRPLMAAIAERLADYLIVTDDNPRREDSAEIIAQIMEGFADPEKVTVQSDRAGAIDFAVNRAGEGDVILIAGKGHEEYQDIGGTRMMFSDVKQARVSLNKRFAGKGN